MLKIRQSFYTCGNYIYLQISLQEIFHGEQQEATGCYSPNTKSVPLLLLYYVVIYCTLFCFSVARSDLSASIATFVFEMICFNKECVFQ